MSGIRKLPDLLVNKIAAGEVVERPASVVKELVENALDAGGDRIQLTIEDGGRKLIRISDNGRGIAAEELALAVTPHATSKISSEADLYSICTMGFRGEALASIGSIAHLRITSRPADATEGAEIYVAGEKIESQSAVGCAPGTTVELRDLFFNVPARRKFLRGASTEFGHIQEQLARLALPNPHVEFEFLHNQRVVKHLPPCDNMLQRIASFYGDDLAQDLISIRRDERGLAIDGYAAMPAQNRSSSKWQYFFLNGRHIRDRFLQHAVKEAYRGLMEHGRFPVVFLALSVDPQSVDVNVHPTKIEVRWQDSNVIYSQVLSALRETFLSHDLKPAFSARRAAAELSPQQRLEERQRIAEFFKQATPPQPLPGSSSSGAGAGSGAFETSSVSMSELAMVYQARPDLLTAPGAPETRLGDAQPTAPAVMQLHRTYLVTETDEGMLVVDQHALHERVIYEQLKSRIAAGDLESQRLLIPETIQMTPQQAALLQTSHDLLKRVGIEISLYGEDTVAVWAEIRKRKDKF